MRAIPYASAPFLTPFLEFSDGCMLCEQNSHCEERQKTELDIESHPVSPRHPATDSGCPCHLPPPCACPVPVPSPYRCTVPVCTCVCSFMV